MKPSFFTYQLEIEDFRGLSFHEGTHLASDLRVNYEAGRR